MNRSKFGKNRYDLEWPVLLRGTLLRRYKRFMADVRLRNGHVVTAHCPNSGSMLECSQPGRPVYLSRHNNPNRRLKYTWEMIEMPTSLVGTNTIIPNRLIKEAVSRGKIKALLGYDNIRSEVRYGENSRIDLLLEKGTERCFVEIKNCTLVRDNTAYFPDAVTLRGLKHLIELRKEVLNGNRSIMLYLVQRMDAKRFEPAHRIDPEYGKELRQAARHGVEILVYDVFMDLKGISLNRPLPYTL